MTKMSKAEAYRQLRALGFSAEQALAELNGHTDLHYDNGPDDTRTLHELVDDVETAGRRKAAADRKVDVAMPRKRRGTRRGPFMEYFARAIPKGRKVEIPAGNNTDVYKVLAALRGRATSDDKAKGATVPDIAKATGIPPHSVESSVYQLRTAGWIERRPINR